MNIIANNLIAPFTAKGANHLDVTSGTSMEFDETKKCKRVKFNIGPIRIDLNPVVTVASSIIIWAFVIWCIIQPKPANQELLIEKRKEE